MGGWSLRRPHSLTASPSMNFGKRSPRRTSWAVQQSTVYRDCSRRFISHRVLATLLTISNLCSGVSFSAQALLRRRRGRLARPSRATGSFDCRSARSTRSRSTRARDGWRACFDGQVESRTRNEQVSGSRPRVVSYTFPRNFIRTYNILWQVLCFPSRPAGRKRGKSS